MKKLKECCTSRGGLYRIEKISTSSLKHIQRANQAYRLRVKVIDNFYF